jgi:diguanylate cyclase (GGDEF)-like protein
LTTIILGLSILAQTLAALIALRQVGEVSGRYQLAWGCLTLALILMIERRVAPLGRYLHTGDLPNTTDAMFGLGISVLMAIGIWGIRRLFIDMRLQESHLDELARTDALTQVPNRREILERLHEESVRIERTGRPLSILMIDIDHFKAVNDEHGHALGDAVLKTVAQCIETSLRRIDHCGRLGGEEFLVLLPEADREEAFAAAERLREAIAASEHRIDGSCLHITVSIGVATRAGSSALAPENLLRAADAALYAAKNAGRNCVRLA